MGLACSIFLTLVMGLEGTCGRRPGFCCSCVYPLWSPLLHPGPIGAHLRVLSSEIRPKLKSVKILASLPTWDAFSHTPMHSSSTPTNIHGTIKHISRTCVLTEGSVCPARHSYSSLALSPKHPSQHLPFPSGSLIGHPHNPCPHPPSSCSTWMTSYILPSSLTSLSPSNPISFPESFPRKLEIMDLSLLSISTSLY